MFELISLRLGTLIRAVCTRGDLMPDAILTHDKCEFSAVAVVRW